MPIQLIAALLVTAMGFGAGWKVQQWRFDAQEAERAKRELVAIQSAAEADLRRQAAIASAQDAAVRRERQLRNDAAGSRDALVGLSHAADAALRAAEASHGACLNRATALSDVLETVSTERRELSEKADRHVSDIQTLTDAWPKP
jgi:chromosome segregation ATPase